MGNLRSVERALVEAGAEVSVTNDPAVIDAQDALCVPGQGILDRCVANIVDLGLDALLRDWISAGRRYLGICLGMQLLFDSSEEAGGTQGLGVLEGIVTRLPDTVSVPHIGWNTVGDDHFYFDHSFAVHPADEGIVTGWCTHGERFAARVDAGAITAVQFHPEKSGTAGIDLLRKWVASE